MTSLRKFAGQSKGRLRPTLLPKVLRSPKNKRARQLHELPASGPPRLQLLRRSLLRQFQVLLRLPRRLQPSPRLPLQLLLRHNRVGSNRRWRLRPRLLLHPKQRPNRLHQLLHQHSPLLLRSLSRRALRRRKCRRPPVPSLLLHHRMASRCGPHLKLLALRPPSVPPRPVNNGPVSRQPPVLRLALLRGPAHNRNVLCRPAIADRSLPEIAVQCRPATAALCRQVIVPADPAPASQCVRISRYVRNRVRLAVKIVLIPRVPRGPAVPADHRIALMGSALAQFLPARVLVRANPEDRECSPRLLRTECPRRRSRASRSIHVVQRNVSVPFLISARWKASASFTPRASVQEQGIAVR